MNKKQIIDKIVNDLPRRYLRGKMTKEEWYGWFEECWNKAINYTSCCTELKELDNDNFEDWIVVNGYAVFDDYYLKDDIAYSESDLIEIYNKEVMNL